MKGKSNKGYYRKAKRKYQNQNRMKHVYKISRGGIRL